MTEPHIPTPPRKIPLGFRIVGALKTIIAVLMVAASFGIFRLMDRDLGAILEHIVLRLHLDPENRLVNSVSFYLLGIDRRHMEAIGAGTFFYALLYGTEGIGIFFGCRWAEYLIVGMTGALIPLEIYEIIHRVRIIKIVVLVANLAILAYFIAQLKAEHRQRMAVKETHFKLE